MKSTGCILPSLCLLVLLAVPAPTVTASTVLETAPETKTSEVEDAAPPLEDLVARAIEANPELNASEARWRMFMQRARQAGTFEDPMLMVGISNGLISDPLNFSKESMTSKVIGISQEVPFFGKRALAREAAEKEILSARAQHEERKLELAQMVKETYARIYFIDHALDIVGRNIQVMDDVIRVAEVRYGVGQGIQQDVLRAQVERSRMVDMQIGLQQQRRSLGAALNRLLYRPADTPFGHIADLTTPPVGLSADALEDLALKSRPALVGLAAEVERGQVEEKLAKREFYPDFTFSFEYMQRDEAMESEGLDMYSANVSFNLPVQRQRRHARVAEAQASTRMARAEVNVLHNEIRGGIADLLAQLEKARKLIDLYRSGIIPQSTRSFESARIAYQNNQVDFSTMLESLLTLFNYEREYYDALSDYRMNLARLEALTGSELPVKDKQQ